MAQAPSNVEVFDPNLAPEDTGAPRRPLIPNGTVANVTIISNEFRTTSKGGTELYFVYEVVDGPHEGRKIHDSVTYTNHSAEAVDIGRRLLGGICKAVNHMKPVADWDVVMGKAFAVRVGVEKGRVRNDGSPPNIDGTPARYNDRNRVQAAMPYQRPGAAGATTPPASPPPTQPPANAGAGPVRVVDQPSGGYGGGIPSAPGGDQYDDVPF